MRTSTWFRFEPPADWEETGEGARLVYRSPKGETLIVSSAAVSGAGEERGKQMLQTERFKMHYLLLGPLLLIPT